MDGLTSTMTDTSELTPNEQAYAIWTAFRQSEPMMLAIMSRLIEQNETEMSIPVHSQAYSVWQTYGKSEPTMLGILARLIEQASK